MIAFPLSFVHFRSVSRGTLCHFITALIVFVFGQVPLSVILSDFDTRLIVSPALSLVDRVFIELGP